MYNLITFLLWQFFLATFSSSNISSRRFPGAIFQQLFSSSRFPAIFSSSYFPAVPVPWAWQGASIYARFYPGVIASL